MSVPIDALHDPAVRAFFTALNAHDEQALLDRLTPDATMADDGTDRTPRPWLEKEVFSANGHIEVEAQDRDGRALIARYRNDTWGEMRTYWHFTVLGEKISRFETGQA